MTGSALSPQTAARARAGLPAETAASFVGRWQITRRIEDAAAGQTGHFEGAAVFEPNGPELLRYTETGQLRLGQGPMMQASRVYLWRFDGPQVTVMFEDGRPFHAFALSGVAEADHWCDPDTYRVAYDFSLWPVWRAVWTVQGPRKDYVMDSTYARA